MTLFDGLGGADDEGEATATAAQVAQLRMNGYNPDVVRTWSKERAGVALGRVKRDAASAARRAASAALRADPDDGAPRPGPAALDRAHAAGFVAEALAAGGELLYFAVVGCAYALTDDELRALAERVLAYLRPAPAVGAVA